MNNAARHLTIALVALSASPALANDEVPITHTDQLVVVTPNPPVVISNGSAAPGAPGAAPAAAPVAAPSGNGAPQNEAWSNVSHINGSLVKVGERGDYLIAHKKVNIATNPIGWMFGVYGVSVSYAVSQNVAIRGDANIVNFDNTEGYEIGASVPIYFRRVYSGPFIEPGLISRGSRSNYCDSSYGGGSCMSSMDTMVGPEVLFGWHWTFDSGLNVAAAFGAARPLAQTEDEYGYSDDDVQPAGYFRIGYAF